jgi:CO dehydrogenase nickel-insertion accessory protein CooC1
VLNKVTPKNEDAIVAKIGATEKILCKLPLSEELADAGLAGDTLDARFEEIQKLIERLK